jgi:hypothetical protein
MKPYILHNESKNISNYIMGCGPFSFVGTMKKVGPYKIQGLTTNAMGHPETLKGILKSIIPYMSNFVVKLNIT